MKGMRVGRSPKRGNPDCATQGLREGPPDTTAPRVRCGGRRTGMAQEKRTGKGRQCDRPLLGSFVPRLTWTLAHGSANTGMRAGGW